MHIYIHILYICVYIYICTYLCMYTSVYVHTNVLLRETVAIGEDPMGPTGGGYLPPMVQAAWGKGQD